MPGIDPIVGGSLVTAGASIIGDLLGISSSKSASELNHENAVDILNREQSYNNWLLGNQKQKMMQDAKDAGMSPAFAQGSILGASSSSPSVSPGSAVPYDFSGIKNAGSVIGDMLLNKPLIQANARLANSKAREQELLNADKEERNKILGSSQKHITVDPRTRVPISNVDDWSLNHPGEIPETVVISVPGSDGSEGRFNARQVQKRWSKELSDISVSMLVNDLQNKVTSGQIEDPDVVESLISMPYKNWSNLVAKTREVLANTSYVKKNEQLLDIEISTAKLEKQIREDSNIYQYINKMFDKGFELKDLAKLLVMSFVGLVNNIGGLSSAIRR